MLKNFGEQYFDDLINIKNQIRDNLTYIIIAIPVLIFAYLVIFAKWRQIKVFISYNNENMLVVESLVDKLRARSLQVEYMPFTSVDPDQLIRNINAKIKSSDVVLVIPGNRKTTSYTDAEVMAALVLNKLIILLKIKDEQHLPNTALSHVPIFDLEKLEHHNLIPLRYFINFVLFHINYAWKACLVLLFTVVFLFLIVSLMVFIVVTLPFGEHLTLNTILFFIAFFSIGGFFVLVQKIYKSSRIVRESIEGRDFRKDEFITMFMEPFSIFKIKGSKEKIMACLSDSILVRVY